MKFLVMSLFLCLMGVQANAKIVTRISNQEAEKLASYSKEVKTAIAQLKNLHIVSIYHEEVLNNQNIEGYNHEVSFYYRHDQGTCSVSVGLGLMVRTNPKPRITYSEPYIRYANSTCGSTTSNQ